MNIKQWERRKISALSHDYSIILSKNLYHFSFLKTLPVGK
jgi:hypothetical protein